LGLGPRHGETSARGIEHFKNVCKQRRFSISWTVFQTRQKAESFSPPRCSAAAREWWDAVPRAPQQQGRGAALGRAQALQPLGEAGRLPKPRTADRSPAALPQQQETGSLSFSMQ